MAVYQRHARPDGGVARAVLRVGPPAASGDSFVKGNRAMNYVATAANLRLQAIATLQEGDRAKAKGQLLHAAELFRYGDRAWEAQTLLDLAELERQDGEPEGGSTHAFEALTAAAEVGDRLRVHLAERLLALLEVPDTSIPAQAAA